MIFRKAMAVASIALLAQISPTTLATAQEKGGMDATGPYDVAVNWFKPGVDGWNQRPASVVADTANRIIVGFVDRNDTQAGFPMLAADGSVMAEKTTAVKDAANLAKGDVNNIVVLNREGKIVENWKQWNAEIGLAHHLLINPYDPQRHIWVVDRFNHQILKLSNDGTKLVLRVGTRGVPGSDATHFHDPASMAFLPDGSFVVADGYVNTRIAKFDKEGKFLFAWGQPGSGPGEFRLPHSVSIGPNNKVFVSDRSNNRIQVFDERGKFLDEWKDVRHGTRILVTSDDSLWVSSAPYGRMVKYDLNGKLLTYWGTFGKEPGQFDNPHQWNIDEEGNLYVAESNNNRVEKFMPKTNADKTRLIAKEYVVPNAK